MLYKLHAAIIELFDDYYSLVSEALYFIKHFK